MSDNALKAWRAAHDLNQGDAAALLHKSRRTISRYETGAEAMPPDVLAAIGKAPDMTTPAAPKPKGGALVKLTEAAEARRLPRPYDFENAPACAQGLERLPASNIPWGADRAHDLRPAGAGWQRIPGCVVICHEAIPEPIPFKAPAWSGHCGILTASGRVFHQLAGHEMHAVGVVTNAPYSREALSGRARAKVAPKAKKARA